MSAKISIKIELDSGETFELQKPHIHGGKLLTAEIIGQGRYLGLLGHTAEGYKVYGSHVGLYFHLTEEQEELRKKACKFLMALDPDACFFTGVI